MHRPRAAKPAKAMKLDRLLRLETLVVIATAVAAGIVSWRVCDGVATRVKVQETAKQLAGFLRSAQVDARQKAEFVRVRVLPSTREHGPICVTESKRGKLSQFMMPEEMAALGMVTLDPQGVPAEEAVFTVRKGYTLVRIHIDARGTVQIP